jgi:hypothetical protein
VCVSAVGRSGGALVSAGQVHRLAALATVASGPFDSCIGSLSGLLGGACLPLQRSDSGGWLRGRPFTQFAAQAGSLDAAGGGKMQIPSERA